MNLISYIKDRKVSIFLHTFSVIFLFALLYLFNVNSLLLIYITVILSLCYIVIFIFDYYRKKKFYNEFLKLLNGLDKKYLIHEFDVQPTFLDAKIMLDSLYEIDKSMYEQINIYKNNVQSFKEYIELWCHEIKTPVATSKLIIENNRNEVTNNIDYEINKINNYIEQVLFYARSEFVEKDYIIKKIRLKDILSNVIKKNKQLLIEKKIKIIEKNVDYVIESDSKWLEFVINQIFMNSIKYSKNKDAKIELSCNEQKNSIILSIEDNGIGIDKSEIEQVFDKGFTGSNGRKKYNSTGLGLYLCKNLCNKLGHSIYISSILNKQTTVKIVFPISSKTNIKN